MRGAENYDHDQTTFTDQAKRLVGRYWLWDRAEFIEKYRELRAQGLDDFRLKKAQEKGGEVVHLPVVICAVVPVYNLKGVNQELNFSGDVIAAIYLGQITKWNDSRIAKENPGVNLPCISAGASRWSTCSHRE